MTDADLADLLAIIEAPAIRSEAEITAGRIAFNAALAVEAAATRYGVGYRECPKCCGTGVVDSFRHVANGVCFKCGGSRRLLR